MSDTSIRIVQPGPLTLVQDAGRSGFQRLGVSVSGAADMDSLLIGNRLVGNSSNAAGLEAMLGALSLEFTAESVFALTGADTQARLDGVLLGTNVSYVAHGGSILELGMATDGLRSYVSIAGGIEAQETLGSRSTHVASEVGGIEGRALKQEDVLAIGAASDTAVSGVTHVKPPVSNHAELEVRVILGPQDVLFSDSGISTFLESQYTITDQSNRQGLRLDGPVVESKSGSYDIISDAVVNGSVQIPGDGKPIVLLADRQTTGGYAKIATVASVDLPLLGQATPGTKLSFKAISVVEAQSLYAEKRELIANSPLEEVIVSEQFAVNDSQYQVGVAQNGSAKLVTLDGIAYPVSFEEITPAN